MQTPLSDLADLTGVIFRAEQARLLILTRQEAALRQSLADLNAARRATDASLTGAALLPVRQTGADVLWQGWVEGRRTDLHQQLALVLAQKANRLRKLRGSYGRKAAARDLLDKYLSDQTQHRARLQTDDIRHMSLIAEARARRTR